MKLVAVTKILNEDDIVEAFVRHHNSQIDHHLFLDNGSVDRSVEILRALKDERLKITVLQNKCSYFNEKYYNTNMFQFAARDFGADWVLFLDTDEFIDARAAPEGLHAHFEALPPDANCLSIPSISYHDVSGPEKADLLIPRRLRHRDGTPNPSTTKIFVRGRLAGYVDIDAGQHTALMNGKNLASKLDEQLCLAHYFRRNPYQLLQKCILGRLKVLAAGRAEIEQNRSVHYTPIFETIRDTPEQILRQGDFLSPSFDLQSLVEDPIHYLGGELRYTHPVDGAMKAIRALAHHAEGLAQDFGHLIDTNEGVKLQAEKMSARWAKLF